MSKTKLSTGLKLAVELLEEHSNDWGGSSEAKEIAASTFAVVVERDDDSWVRAAPSWHDVAQIILDCYTATEGYDEWVAAVYDMRTGEVVRYSERLTLTLTYDSGQWTAHSPPLSAENP